MPTFNAIALERLLEPTARDWDSSSAPTATNSKLDTNNNNNNNNNLKHHHHHHHLHISPALYTTPKPTPIPNSSPSSLSPSPYVVNRKRRDICPPNSRLDGFNVKENSQDEDEDEDEDEAAPAQESVNEMGDHASLDVPFPLDDEAPTPLERDSDEFSDPCDSACNTNDRGNLQPPLSNQSEFYDAPEDFFSDVCASLPSPFSSNVETELRAARLNLLEEFERRKKAEEALGHMHSQWQQIADHLSQVGLSFPATLDADNILLEMDSVEQFCQEIVVARFVSEAVGRGQARIEAEAAAEAVIDTKNHEIARLQDKLQYYEAVNHEMSQRNQEVIETSRRQRQSRLRRKKWIWSCIGLSVALGASVLACSYVPQLGNELPTTSNDGSDTSSSMPTSINVHS